MELLPVNELPKDFDYPKEFLWLIDIGIINIKPWHIHSGEGLRSRYVGIKKRYPNRLLIPFAHRQDNDEVACWDIDDENKIKVIEDFTRANTSEDVVYNNFWEWFQEAIKEMIDFSKKDLEN